MSCEIELEVGTGAAPGELITRVVNAPSGGGPSAAVQLDVDGLLQERDALESTVLASAVSGRRIVLGHEQQLQRVGRQLFEALFTGPVLGTYRASYGIAQERNEPLRVVLAPATPQLAALPWEAMFDPENGAYICREEPLVRRVPAPYTRDPLEVTPPLRVLGLVASPRGLPPLDVDAEQERLSRALAAPVAEGLIEVTWLTQASWDGVQEKLLSDTWHVLHFIGHGDYDEAADQGVIALVDEDGRANLVGAERLANLLKQARPTPRLVVLNSCSSGEQGTQDLFSGTAAALVHSGISAVAAMQFTVSDPAAISFARGFYTAIAHGRSVDDAVGSGRIAILGRPNTLEWVTPVLYVRGKSTQLFTLTPAVHKGREEKPAGQGASQSPPGRQQQTPPAEARPTIPPAQLRAMYVEARAELRANHYDTAIGLLDDLLSLDPDYPDAIALRENAFRERELADKYQRAVAAQASGDCGNAARLYTEILKTQPDYRDAAARRQQCEAAERIVDLQDEMRYHADAKNWQAVIDVSHELTALDPAAVDLGLVTRAHDALSAATEAAEHDQRYTRGRAAEDAGDWADAVRLYGDIVGYRDAETRLHACQLRLRVAELISRLDEFANAEDCAGVHETFTELAALDAAAAEPFAELDARARQALLVHCRPLFSFQAPAYVLAWDPSGGRIAVATDSTWVYVDDLVVDEQQPANAKLKQSLALQTGTLSGSATSVTFDRSGARIATSNQQNQARIWDATSGEQLFELPHLGTVWSVAFNPDGTRLATGGADNAVGIWDTGTGQKLLALPHRGTVWSVEFSPDGARLASGSDDNKAHIWDAASARQLVQLEHSDAVNSVAFSPDGTRLCTGSDTALIWDTRDGRQLLELPHGDSVSSVAFSPDGTRIATGCQDGFTRIWDAITAQLLLESRCAVSVAAVAFSPDGKYLASAGGDVIRLWRVADLG